VLEIIFHPAIKTEVKVSYDWYQKQASGLGDDYISELESAYQTICEIPETWPKFEKGSRRFLLRKFPFSVIYYFNEKTVFVVAVMHNSRKPGYWKERL